MDRIRTITEPKGVRLRDSMTTMLVDNKNPADATTTQVVGTTQLFEGGVRRCVPMPSPDPKDPLNLPEWRKWSAIATLAIFGALALSAEAIVGALVPIFVLEYAGIDPKILGSLDLSALSVTTPGGKPADPLQLLNNLGGPPLVKVNLISTLPTLVNGIASYFLVPFSIAYGRRPVLLFAGLMAWAGGLWAGFSTSLDSHIAARVFQGFGAGAVEALIPLVLQDMLFIHQRNKAFSLVGAGQGIFIVAIGVTSPIIVVQLSWRWIYYITSGLGILAWLGMIFLVPETRWERSRESLGKFSDTSGPCHIPLAPCTDASVTAGQETHPVRPGENRPRLDYAKYGYRTNMDDFGIFHIKSEWALAGKSVIETFKATFFPNVLWVIALNSIFVGALSATQQNAAAIILGLKLNFNQLGIVVLPIVVAAPFVWFFGGYLADRISNWHAKRNNGQREPEAHLISLAFPLLAGIVGPLLFGFAGENTQLRPIGYLMGGFFLIGFGGLTMNTLVSVYLVESYPNYAGYVHLPGVSVLVLLDLR